MIGWEKWANRGKYNEWAKESRLRIEWVEWIGYPKRIKWGWQILLAVMKYFIIETMSYLLFTTFIEIKHNNKNESLNSTMMRQRKKKSLILLYPMKQTSLQRMLKKFATLRKANICNYEPKHNFWVMLVPNRRLYPGPKTAVTEALKAIMNSFYFSFFFIDFFF